MEINIPPQQNVREGLILEEGVISSEYGNPVSISSAVEEPGNKAEEVGKVFCACDYMVVLTQIRLINIAKLFKSFRMQLSALFQHRRLLYAFT